MLLNDGKYKAKLSGPTEQSKSGIIIYETTKGALCAAVPCTVDEGGADDGKELKNTLTIVKQDGTVNTKNIDTLKAIFGIGGTIESIFGLMDNEFPEARFEIVVEGQQGENEDGTPTVDKEGNPVLFSRIKWLNALGAGIKMPEPADRKSVLAKYGSKFRALAGGAPAKAPAASKPGAPGKPPTATSKKSPPPSAKTLPPSTMDECWEIHCSNTESMTDQERTDIWFSTIRGLLGETIDTGVMTPDQWGKVKDKLADNVP
jgi:hypothetical protein